LKSIGEEQHNGHEWHNGNDCISKSKPIDPIISTDSIVWQRCNVTAPLRFTIA
jgi:hypothetical protein